MKRIVSFVLCLLILVVPAFADVPSLPYPNGFYKLHQNQCSYVDKLYWVNGSEGYVTLWNSPNQEKAIENIPNGESVVVEVRWNEWGCINRRYGDKRMAVWVPMDCLAENYGSEHFRKEFASELFEDMSLEYALKDYKCVSEEGVCFYSYPGSGEVERRTDIGDWHDTPAFLIFYTDADGRTWGMEDYYYGIKNCWVCLDDPENAELPMTLDRQPKLRPAKADCENAPFIHYGTRQTTVYIASAAAGLAAVGAALIIYKKRRSRA